MTTTYPTRSGEPAPLTRKRIEELAKRATRYGTFGDGRHGATVQAYCPLVLIADWLPKHWVEAQVSQYDSNANTAVKALRQAVRDHLDPDNAAIGDADPATAHLCPGLHAARG